MSSDKPQVFRFKVERRERATLELVMTEDQFKRWFIANGGKLVSKLNLTTQQELLPQRGAKMARVKREAQTTTATVQAVMPKPDRKSQSARTENAVVIPTITIMSGAEPDDALYAVATGSKTPVVLVVDDQEAGPTHTLLMPNTVTKLLFPDDEESGSR